MGPINVDDQVRKEVIFILDKGIASNKFFNTDSNGRVIMKRERNARHNSTDYYYPINSRIYISNGEKPRRHPHAASTKPMPRQKP